MNLRSLLFAVCSALPLVHSQYPPQITHVYEIESPVNPDIKIRFKSPDSKICHTSNTSQKQYSGHIHLPPGTLAPIEQDYPINTFFWFFEARQDPQDAPLTIWLNGGPGSSSLIGLFQEIGPCEVVQADPSHLKTSPREFGWDRASNLLFIDQPNQVGFSYDTATNGVLPLLDLNNRFIPNVSAPPDGGGHMYVNTSDPRSVRLAMEHTNLLNGTFSSGNAKHTANTTQIAAQATWHFLQTWISNFPQYCPKDNGLQFVAESYGGHYGPVFSAYIEEQNERLVAGKLPPGTKELHLSSLGIVNGCVDELVQSPYYAIYGNHNPYNITAISRNAADRALNNFFKPGGCKDQILECRKLKKERDPLDVGDNELVNLVCRKADTFCGATQMSTYFPAGRGVYDIAHADPDPFPPNFYLEFLNNATVQQAISAPVNYTQSNSYVYRAFGSTGDMPRGGELDDLAYLLDRGVRVALIYGDRDYICNYMGGEAVSLAVNYSQAEQFATAGYEDVEVNSTYIGGQVRQHGNFSFIRVFQAGHLVPAYQPETAFTIFKRLIHGKSIATGQEIVTSGNDIYASTGPKYSTIGLIPPPPPPPVCFIRAASGCTKEQFAMLAAGQGVIINGILYNSTDEYTGPGYAGAQVCSNASVPGTYHTGSTGFSPPNQAPSGVFGNTIYPPHQDGLPLIPDNIDPERVIEKDETQERGELEYGKNEGDSKEKERSYSSSGVEEFDMAPFTQIVDSGEKRMGELFGGVGLGKYVGDEPGIGDGGDDGGY